MSLTPIRLESTRLPDTYRQHLLNGDREAAKALIETAITRGLTPYALLNDLIWPTMETIQAQHRDDQIPIFQFNLATRLNRQIADQLGSQLVSKPLNGKKALVLCGNAEPEDLGGQIVADLFSHEGYEVRFAGGGVPDDEVHSMIGQFRPNLLILFATLPSAVPSVRKLINHLRELNANPELQVLCCGGIYQRAEGLAEEIGADLYAPNPAAALKVTRENPMHRATSEQQTVGRNRKNRPAIQKVVDHRPDVAGKISPMPLRAKAV